MLGAQTGGGPRTGVWMPCRRSLLTLILVLTLAGCAGLGGHRDTLRVTVSDIQVIEATLLEQVYRVTLRVQNRGDRALAIHGGSFDLALNGRDFGSGVTDQALQVPAWSDAKIEVRMVSTVFGWVRLIQGMQSRAGEPLQYAIDGSFSIDGAFGTVGFRETGEIELPRSSPAAPLPEGGLGT